MLKNTYTKTGWSVQGTKPSSLGCPYAQYQLQQKPTV